MRYIIVGCESVEGQGTNGIFYCGTCTGKLTRRDIGTLDEGEDVGIIEGSGGNCPFELDCQHSFMYKIGKREQMG